MSKNILLISDKTVKERGIVNENVDSKYINFSIKYSQDVFIEPALGTNLYLKIQSDIESGNLIADYKTLVDDYITDALLYFVLSEITVALSAKFHNKGIYQQTSDNAITPSLSELMKLSQLYKDKAEFYLDRLIKYLKEHGNEKFTEYKQYGIAIDEVKPKKSGYSSQIYLDDDYDDDYGSFEEKYQA